MPGRDPAGTSPADTAPDAAPAAAAPADFSTGRLDAGQVQTMFDRVAGVYDLLNTVMTAGLHHRWRERAVEYARVGPGSRVLDVATGTGDLALALARRVSPSGEVVGSDFSEGMLARARAKAERRRERERKRARAGGRARARPTWCGAGASESETERERGRYGASVGVAQARAGAGASASEQERADEGSGGAAGEFKEEGEEEGGVVGYARGGGGEALSFEWGDALQLPYPDDSFDAATVGFGARNFSDLARGLAEMVRVVRPGGRVVVLEMTTPTKPPLSTFYGLWFDRAVPVIGRLAALASRRREASSRGTIAQAYTYLPSSVKRFHSPAELVAELEHAGCVDVEYVLMAGGIIALHGATVPR